MNFYNRLRFFIKYKCKYNFQGVNTSKELNRYVYFIIKSLYSNNLTDIQDYQDSLEYEYLNRRQSTISYNQKLSKYKEDQDYVIQLIKETKLPITINQKTTIKANWQKFIPLLYRIGKFLVAN